jgi:hypothetical protein
MSGFQSPNYTQTPNDLFDELLPDMGLAELKVVMCIVRHTFGYHKDEVKLSVRAIARFTGLTANSVMEGAKQAEAHGLIERHLDGNKTTTWTAIVSVVPTKTRRISKRDAGVPPTETQLGVKERVKKPLKIKEGASATPPEVKLYREVTKKYPPSPNYEDVVTYIQSVAKRLGRDVLADDLRPFYKAWTAKGWNQFSINWLEYAVRGELPQQTKGANYANRTPTPANGSQPATPDPALIERINAQRAARRPNV